jgi:hypothetical protein
MSTRGEVFRRPAGNRKYELESCAEQPRNSWTINRQESDQFCRFVKKFKQEYADANILQVTYAERFFKAAIMLQRLEDRRVFFAGDETGAKKFDKFYLEVEPEEAQRKAMELQKWGAYYLRELLECGKVLLANGINISVNGDLATIFKLDEETRKAMGKYKSEGGSTQIPETD